MNEETQQMNAAMLAELATAKYNRFVGTCGIKAHEIKPDWAQAEVVVHDEIRNTYGNIHGGMVFTLADTVSGMVARTDGRRYVTQSANFEFLDNVNSGTVYGTGKIIRRGYKMVVVGIEITSEDGKLLAVGTFNMMPVSRPALLPDEAAKPAE